MKATRINKKGYALMTVMSIMAIMAIVFSMLMKMGAQSAHMGTILKNRTKASAYAEAGIEYAYAVLRDNYDFQSDPTQFVISSNSSSVVSNTIITTYGEGQFALTLTPQNSGQYVIINSVGTCGHSTVEVEAMIEDTNFRNGSAWDNAVFAGGEGSSKVAGGGFLDSEGNAQTVYVNGDIALSGGADIEAYVRAHGTVSGNNIPTVGDAVGNQPHVSMPSLESRYESFATYAASANEKISGDYTLKKTHTVGGNGIMYVDGDVTIKGAFYGTIIATGEVVIQAGGSISAGSSGIAIATQTGSIRYGTTADCDGLFYAELGNFVQQASQGNLTGQIIVGGIIDKTGGSGITFVDDGEDEDLNANPVIAGWQK